MEQSKNIDWLCRLVPALHTVANVSTSLYCGLISAIHMNIQQQFRGIITQIFEEIYNCK